MALRQRHRRSSSVACQSQLRDRPAEGSDDPSEVRLEATLARQTADGEETDLFGSPGRWSLSLRGISCHVLAQTSSVRRS